MNKLILLLVACILLINAVKADSYSGSGTNTYWNSGWGCSVNSSSSSWVNYDDGNKIDVMLNGVMVSGGNCTLYRSDSGGTCCPSEKSNCWADGICRTGGEICANYNTSASCSASNGNDWNSQVAKNSVSNSSICGMDDTPIYTLVNSVYGPSASCINETACSCAWINNQCSGKAEPVRYCENATGGFYSATEGYCYWTTPSDSGTLACDVSGVITYTSKANWTGSPSSTSLAKASCSDITRTYACPETAQLPFFGMLNLLISVILIGVLYFFVRRD